MQTSQRVSVPRDPSNDYTPEAAAARREFLRERTGVALEHVGAYSFDPELVSGNVEHFTGVAQVPCPRPPRPDPVAGVAGGG